MKSNEYEIHPRKDGRFDLYITDGYGNVISRKSYASFARAERAAMKL